MQKAHFIVRILISCSEFCFLSLCSKGGNCRFRVQMGVSGVKSVSLHVGFDVMCVTGAPWWAHTRSDGIKSITYRYTVSIEIYCPWQSQYSQSLNVWFIYTIIHDKNRLKPIHTRRAIWETEVFDACSFVRCTATVWIYLPPDMFCEHYNLRYFRVKEN